MTKILVIEDEESVRENILDLLEAESFETLAAADGKIGIDLAISEVPDLILCDLMMPNLDGYEVLKKLHLQAVTATIPFVFLTARTAKADLRKGMNLGADDYLTKPFTRSELLNTIMSRLEKKVTAFKYISKTNKNTARFLPEFQILKTCLLKTLAKRNLKEFQVNYQPIVDSGLGNIVAAESLIRWESPELGLISPAELIPLAESTGLIIPIGEWLIKNVCKQTKIWQDAGYKNFYSTVNISINQLIQPDFVSKILSVLAENNLHPSALELEITEGMVEQDVNTAINRMEELQSYGLKLAIDDFGVGRSSLIYLKQLPINTLKIDHYFIHNIDKDIQKAAITKGIIEMAHNLNLEVVAEGVETKAELNIVRAYKCDKTQGYFLSHPLAAAEFEELLLTDKRLIT
ncbi:MAG: EAL domain-containing response regulator [Richelia sp. RM2_1_2]|nr:EAL domain-containing response regulator [Richelia sp. SM2_1_7]NJM17294.1 EAL domain-containing response regulator [Richelia sp. SM1_7_0]NJN09759.1 EAL domain-containing response regulator [Richelia sp. RM1_1_1]NJO29743.1 EAL domain-containing response regulator [Richelia sp. SL_2_1]NJO57569.1 EAL domain-containing response regulator [Richelia sp. RM2_1_2]